MQLSCRVITHTDKSQEVTQLQALLSPPLDTLWPCMYFCLFFLGSKESLLSATISANEEAMTILEEVIMYTFQQCVYYITKVFHVSSSWCIFKLKLFFCTLGVCKDMFFVYVLHLSFCVCSCVQALYVVLPGLLDCNPFPLDSSDPCWKGGVGFPEPVRRILQVSLCISTLLLISCRWSTGLFS